MKKAQQQINDATMNFSGMADTARQIESLATMLRILSENGGLNEDLTDDAAALIQEKATALRHMIDEAQCTAYDIEKARIVADTGE